MIVKRSFRLARSLSALLPFRDAQAVVLSLLPGYIDGLSDLTPDWELVLVDDGSTDATPEILCEFAHAYPQVRLAIHAQTRGAYLAYCTALALSRGETLFLPLSYRPVNLDGLHRLWAASKDVSIVVGIFAGSPARQPAIECLMIQRSVASPILSAISSPARLMEVLTRFEPDVTIVNLGAETGHRREEFKPAFSEMYTAAQGPEGLPPPKSAFVRPARVVSQPLEPLTFGE